MSLTIIIVIIIAVVGGGAVVMYNSLVRLGNQVDNAWSQIDVQLKRRHDLIPNLVETAKGYMQHERQTFESITQARAQAVNAGSVKESSKAEGLLNHALGNFMLTVEAYPDLKANQNFLSLQEELSSTENKIAFARQSYNDQVLFFNNKLQQFPSNVVGRMFGFSSRDYFELENPEEKNVPEVKF